MFFFFKPSLELVSISAYTYGSSDPDRFSLFFLFLIHFRDVCRFNVCDITLNYGENWGFGFRRLERNTVVHYITSHDGRGS